MWKISGAVLCLIYILNIVILVVMSSKKLNGWRNNEIILYNRYTYLERDRQTEGGLKWDIIIFLYDKYFY